MSTPEQHMINILAAQTMPAQYSQLVIANAGLQAQAMAAQERVAALERENAELKVKVAELVAGAQTLSTQGAGGPGEERWIGAPGG